MSFIKTLATLAIGVAAAKGYDRFRQGGGMAGLDATLRGAGAAGGLADQIGKLGEKMGRSGSAQAVRAFHAEHGIVTESWSPLASGKQVLADPVIGAIAAKHGCTPAQAIIAWHLALDCVVIPKSVTPSRIAENFAATQVSLDADDLADLAALDRGFRTGPDPDTFNLV